MTWSQPRTWATGEMVTAAQLNQEIRDNLNGLKPVSARIDVLRTTASTAYTDLTGDVGPQITLPTLTAVTVIFAAEGFNNGTNYSYAAVAVSGATTRAAQDGESLWFPNIANNASRAASTARITGLTPGTNTFTMKYKVQAGTGSFNYRELQVIAA